MALFESFLSPFWILFGSFLGRFWITSGLKSAFFLAIVDLMQSRPKFIIFGMGDILVPRRQILLNVADFSI